MHTNIGRSSLSKALAMASLTLSGALAVAQLPGAIWTTNSKGNIVNGNIYRKCEDVYLNGGPQNTSGGKSLPNGVYYFQVTNPNGRVLLSNDDAKDRCVLVVGGKVAYRCYENGVVISNPTKHPIGAYNAKNLSSTVQLWPFDKTPNNGGMYKAWLIARFLESDPSKILSTVDPVDPRKIVFEHRWAKTDNFKCSDTPPPPAGRIGGTKWFDLNANGKFEKEVEPPIADYVIKITMNPGKSNETTYYAATDNFGNWQFPPAGQPEMAGGTPYRVCEILPPHSVYSAGVPGNGPLQPKICPVTNPSACPSWEMTWGGGIPGNDPPNEANCYEGVIPNGFDNSLIFGNTQRVRVCGTKFYDTNLNGARDEGEPGVSGITITIKTKQPTEDEYTTETVVTDSSGEFCSRSVLISTKYEIKEESPGSCWKLTSAKNPICGVVELGEPDKEVRDPFTGEVIGEAYSVRYCQDDEDGNDFGNILVAGLKVYKYFDTSMDGTQQDTTSEPPIQGFKFKVITTMPGGQPVEQTVTTDSKGCAKILNQDSSYPNGLFPDGTTYQVCEIPLAGWNQTQPANNGCYEGTLSSGLTTYTNACPNFDLRFVFGNWTIRDVNAHTKGYWHNNNGYATMMDGGTIQPEFNLLNALCLVRLNGSPADFSTFTDFSNWITNESNASNMACQLSAQLAAMTLNVEAGFVLGSQFIYAPGATCANPTTGIAKLSDLLKEANDWLCPYPITVNASTARTHQGILESALDRGNNNVNWVPTPITYVVYP